MRAQRGQASRGPGVSGGSAHSGDEALAEAIQESGDTARFLRETPEAATPSLVRRLKERVEELQRIDAGAAEKLAESVFLVAQRSGDLPSLALAHRARGLAALATGSRRDALRHYEAAEEIYRRRGEDVERAKVLRSMMDALAHLGRYDEALAAGEEAKEVFRRHRLPVLAAQADANLGFVLWRMDRNAESLDALDRALRTFRSARDEEAVAMVEFNRAGVLLDLNELAEAERGYRRVLPYYRAQGLRLREAQCLHSLAYLAAVRFRYSESLRLFDRVKELDGELGDLRHAALCTFNKAELLASLNAWEEACDLAREAQDCFDELGMRQEAANAVLLRALSAVHLQSWDRAGGLLEDAARRFEAEGSQAFLALTDLYAAELALRRGDVAGALARSRRAARVFSRAGLRSKEAYARVVAARSLLRQGDTAGARRQCLTALERLRRSPSAWIAFQAHHLLGKTERSAAGARRHLDEALANVERLRTHVLPDELRASFQQDKLALYDDYVGLLLSDGAGGSLEDAFSVVEAAKARILGDYLARLSVEHEGSVRDRGARRGATLRKELEELNACYRRLSEAEVGERPQSAGDALRSEIQEREATLSGIFRDLQLGGPSSAGAPLAGGGDLLAAVRRALARDEVLVEFFFLAGELHAFLVSRTGLQWVPGIAALSELREAIARWQFQAEKAALGRVYADARRDSLRRAENFYLDRLGELVWNPLSHALGSARKLVVVPAGPLFYVPFHALRHEGEFLVERFEISLAASARSYAAAGRRKGRRRAPPLVLGLERPDLPSIAGEIEAVARQLPGSRVLRGEQARRSALRTLGNGAAVVHIASHAVFRSDNPLLSAIELADGRLSFYDLFDMRLDSELVVLSGCQTGRLQVLGGDELVGLSRGFLYAGVASLIASLWPVDDTHAARFMERFYAALGQDLRPRAALATTMRELLGEGMLPSEWAPFYATGRP